ncbi:MAG TPA: TonB-dependent receptor [Campylobacterales bacterium]|nr:TonB-dependent receptor [Campylobacterales bacterium]
MNSKHLPLSLIAISALLTNTAIAETELDPIVVSADFREAKLSQTSNAITVIGEEKLYSKASQPLVEVLGSTANVNFTAGASKAKYIQIRGIGERSQFKSPVNPSVGFMVDGMDYSNNLLGASLFDVQQIEVLRGPQGTAFGANGMAGVINVTSNEPTKETEAHVEATVGNYNTKAFGAAIGGTLIDDTLLGRVSVYKNDSDGFMKNAHLNREDTNNIDELNVKAALKWLVNETNTLDINIAHTDVDNGYDAFTLDNSRTSYSDEPGKDTLESDAIALKLTSELSSKVKVITKLSHLKSDSLYSYDEDWSHPSQFDNELAIINQGVSQDSDDYIWPYNWHDEYKRETKLTDFDMRLISGEDGRIFKDTTDWTVGIYAKKQTEVMNRNETGFFSSGRSSYNYETQSKAVYGQLDHSVSDKITLTTGLRVEKWEADYKGSDATVINTDETLVGGKISLAYQQNKNNIHYLTFSKGYKPGGINADTSLALDDRKYQTEALWNIDAGRTFSALDNALKARFNVFYGEREDQQVKLYNERERSFVDFLSNAAKGSYYGLESELDYYANDNLHLYSSLGLLRAKFDTYTPALEGRAPAQSPKYQYNIGMNYGFTDELALDINVEGKDAYYFSNKHNNKSDSYNLLNSSLNYNDGEFGVSLWARNLTDEDYQTRGFSFGNNPSKSYATETFTQQGMPRTFGVTVGYDY